MPFASGNKKQANVYDNRVAAADNAIVLQNGGFLFAPQSSQPNETIAGTAGKPNWNVLIIAGAAVAAFLVVTLNRKT